MKMLYSLRSASTLSFFFVKLGDELVTRLEQANAEAVDDLDFIDAPKKEDPATLLDHERALDRVPHSPWAKSDAWSTA